MRNKQMRVLVVAVLGLMMLTLPSMSSASSDSTGRSGITTQMGRDYNTRSSKGDYEDVDHTPGNNSSISIKGNTTNEGDKLEIGWLGLLGLLGLLGTRKKEDTPSETRS